MRDIRTVQISNERDTILSNTEQSIVPGEVQGIFHTNHQQDAHESLLQFLDILHRSFPRFPEDYHNKVVTSQKELPATQT